MAVQVVLHQVNDATTEGMARTHRVFIDRPEQKGGYDRGPMGGEMLLLALGGCFNSNLLAAIKARDVAIDDISITIDGHLVEAPSRFETIDMTVHSSYADRDTLQKLVTIAERGCIVANSIKNAVKLNVSVAELNTQSATQG